MCTDRERRERRERVREREAKKREFFIVEAEQRHPITTLEKEKRPIMMMMRCDGGGIYLSNKYRVREKDKDYVVVVYIEAN